MKKIATLLISLVIILLSCLTVSANTPTAISTEAELRSITSSGNYYLAKDITLTGNFTTLPTFSGTLDGRGKTISGLKISTTAGIDAKVYGGLFKTLEGGTVKNLTLKDVDIEISGGKTVYAGAVAGKIDSGSVFNCRVSGKITAHKGNANIHIGGITGVNSVSYAEIYLCENYASISAEGQLVIAGGIAGEHSRQEAEIKQCANYGTISATGNASENYAGGIVGRTAGSVSNCANFGSVTLNSDVNGCVGGITAKITQGKISKCFSGGVLVCEVMTDSFIDPIAPKHKNDFENNYYLDTIIKDLKPTEIKTSSALDSKATLSTAAFSGFDFNNCWEMKNSTLKLRGITCPMPISTEQNGNNTSSSSTTTSSSQTSGNQTSSQPTTSVPSSSEPTFSDVAESSPAESSQTTSTSTSSLPDDKEPQYDFDFIMKHTPPIWVFVIIAVVLLAGVGAFLYFYENRKK